VTRKKPVCLAFARYGKLLKAKSYAIDFTTALKIISWTATAIKEGQ
jgi:hypothetical protein